MRIVWCCVVIACMAISAAPVSAISPYTVGTTGIDVSWPEQNCHIITTSHPHASFAIIGVNHGLDFTGNSCLQQEAAAFHLYTLYLNTGYPGIQYGRKFQSFPKQCSRTDRTCLAFNYGFNAARYSVHYAAIRNIHTTYWWLDVETDNSWTTSQSVNIASLSGMVAALQTYIFLPTIGFYALPGQWNALTGGWKNDMLAWAATGSISDVDAHIACNEPSFTGGKLILTQYTLQLDQDYVCP